MPINVANRFIYALVLCLFVVFVGKSNAQPASSDHPDPDMEERSGNAVNTFAGVCGNSDPLVNFRRAALREGTLVTSEPNVFWFERQAFAINTHTYESFMTGLKRYRGHTGVLFYAHDRQVLCMWLFDATGLIAYHAAHVTEGDLSGAILDFRFALSPVTREATRAPSLRRLGDLNSPDLPIFPRGRIYKELNRASAPLISPSGLKPFERQLLDILLPETISSKLKQIDHLVIVPTGPISLTPFAALHPFGDGRYLIDAVDYSIAPGLAEIGIGATLSRALTATLPEGTSLVVGNPRFDDPDWNFPILPGAESEARTAATLLQVKPLIGADATLANVLKIANDPSRLGLLYFASHVVADTTNPYASNRSFVALAGGDRFMMADIRKLKLAPRALVVLSACQSGLGSVQAAGIGGLARGFEIGGASSVIMSLWNIDDDASADLMSSFVKSLTKKSLYTSVAGSLRSAMVTSRTTRPDPAYWAQFEVFGVEQFQ